MSKYADFLAIPLASIYNKITLTKIWPVIWKKEYVTVIPKGSNPSDMAGLRNISCTQLASKIYESYVLNWAGEEVKLKSNQFGGVKGCSTSHMLVELTQDLSEDLEDCRAATVLTAIDFAKAFNRLSYQHCLRSLAEHGASTDVIRLIATFLSNRTMSVRVGKVWSEERAVTGGCSQGSILGVFLFNVTIDDLEDTAPGSANDQVVQECAPPSPSGEATSATTEGSPPGLPGTEYAAPSPTTPPRKPPSTRTM